MYFYILYYNRLALFEHHKLKYKSACKNSTFVCLLYDINSVSVSGVYVYFSVLACAYICVCDCVSECIGAHESVSICGYE